MSIVNEEIRASRRRISRRRALGLGGTVGLTALLAACGGGGAGRSATSTVGAATSPTTTGKKDAVIALLDGANTCVLAREETQGPFWFDVDSIRSDIREDRPGTTLSLALRVHDLSGCVAGGDVVPVPNCVVEIWHCDAGGAYSGFESGPVGAGAGAESDGSYSQGDVEASPTEDGTYLRGAQVANQDGVVRFTTIYPGWYPGRTVHIHLKVHVDKETVLTTQLFFDESLNDEAFAATPYDEHTGRDTTNENDAIFDDSGLLTSRSTADGYLGVINLGLGT